jgi:tetratricopeptide (TPR) repeat protein
VADRSPGDLQAVMGSGAASIAQLDADIARRLPELPPIPSLEPEQARFRLFDSITGFFKQASQAAPVVVFLDDLHWADAASLLLLQFLARELKNFRVLVIGAYRDQALGRHHPLAQTLGVLAGQGLDRRIHLRGLSEADVARFVEMTTGLEPAERLVTAIYKETEGNPFFVKEVVRFLAATGQLDQASQATTWSITLPQGVREVVTRRLAQLSDESSRTLSVASVIGRDFDLGLLEQAGDLDTEQLADAIDEAVASQLIVESDGAAGQYRFSHALIRETLYEGVTSTKRARLHRRIGEFLEERARNQLDRYLPQLAHHFLQASRLGQIDKAIDYAVRAAERADQLLAFEEAVGQYTAVLRVLERRQPPDPAKHCELLLTLGDVQVKAGLADLARESFIQAATLATQLGSAESLARAALGLGAGTVTRTRLGQAIDDVQIRLLREALDRAGDRESPLHGRLLAQLALALYHAPEERAVLSEQAVMVSRRVGDPAALLAALYSRCVALEGFNSAHERLELAAEIVQVADRAGDPEMALRGHFRCYREHMELCDMAGVERELEQYTRLAERLRQPRYLWVVPYCRASLALFRGQFQESELALREALTIGRRAQDPNCTLFCSIVTYTLSFCRGALDDVERMLKGIIEKYPSTSLAWRLQLTRLYCYVDRLDEARREYEPLAARDFDDLYIDGSYVSTLVGLCTIAWYLDDRRRVEKIAQRLEPFRGLTVVAGNSGIAGGPATAGLAVAAAALGRWDEAEASFEEASATSRRLGSKPWTVWTTALYLRMLALSGRPGDQQRARARLPQALAQSHEIGMDWIMMPVEHLLSDTNTR